MYGKSEWYLPDVILPLKNRTLCYFLYYCRLRKCSQFQKNLGVNAGRFLIAHGTKKLIGHKICYFKI